MKSLILTIALTLSGVVTGQIQGVRSYEEVKEIVYGEPVKIGNEYFLKFDYMEWGVFDLGNTLEECSRILTANGKSFDEPDYDESTIIIGDIGFYDIGISSLIFDGLAIRKAWGIPNEEDSNTFYLVTLTAGYSGIEMLIAKVNK